MTCRVEFVVNTVGERHAIGRCFFTDRARNTCLWPSRMNRRAQTNEVIRQTEVLLKNFQLKHCAEALHAF